MEYLSLSPRYHVVATTAALIISTIAGETAWQEIYGFRTGAQKGTLPFAKDAKSYTPSKSMVAAPDGTHGRQRKAISHAFSDHALREQESLFQSYIDLFILRLTEANEHVDICEYLNWVTFDIIADLVFGRPFGCLEDKKTHGYVSTLLRAIKAVQLYYIKSYLPMLLPFTTLFMPGVRIADFALLTKYAAEETENRISMDTQRPDFMTSIMKHHTQNPEDGGITRDEIDHNVRLLMVAGTETTATTLSVAVLYLLKNASALEKLRHEVRGTFQSTEEVTLESVTGLEYTTAVIHESLRMMPPVPNGSVRKVPPGGAMVNGRFIPEMATISVSQYPAYRSTRNFKNPDHFDPERWLGAEEYKDDNRAVFQPFSFGPRNCLGKNLAYAEMRLILAKMVSAFDWELAPECRDWDERCDVHVLWTKPELKVRFLPVKR